MSYFLQLVQAEWDKQWRMARSYWVTLLADQLFFILGFLIVAGLFDLISEGNFDGWARLYALIGYLTWRVAGGCMVEISGSVAVDARFGTLEQVWLSNYPAAIILFARGIALILFYTLRTLGMALIIMPLLQIPLPFVPAVLPIYLLTMLGVQGVSFGLAGLHLIYKNVSPIVMPIGTTLLFLTGALAPLDGIPILYPFSQFLPLSGGIELMRALAIDSMPLAEILSRPQFSWFLLNTAGYVIIGLSLLRWAQKRAVWEGSLAHY
ncbi:MAG: ABC transporter permease [Anaerolineae bacterium]|nr:ABC transporter permease [Anaerolineae bacterium]